MSQRVLFTLTKGTLKTYCYIIFFILKGHFCPPCPSQQKARGAAAPPAPPVPASLCACNYGIASERGRLSGHSTKHGLDWTGQLDWTVGLDSWTGQLDWTVGLDSWTGLLDWTIGLNFEWDFFLSNRRNLTDSKHEFF